MAERGAPPPERGLTYILALPYSGSSLFALALGNADGFVNLGEMNYLENDLNERRTCSCGALVTECAFWGPLIARAKAERAAGRPMLSFDTSTRLRAVDRRNPSLATRLALIFGRSLQGIYGAEDLRAYRQDHLGFMKLALEETGSHEVIDAAKNARRLQVFAEASDLPLRVIAMSRRPVDAFAARIKRARRRNRFYRQALAPAYVFWLLHHYRQMRSALRGIPPRSVYYLNYEDFVSDPKGTEKALSRWYGRTVSFGRTGPADIRLDQAHVYTGNIWITRGTKGAETVTLRPPPKAPDLTRFELAQFRFFALLFPVLRHGLTPRRVRS